MRQKRVRDNGAIGARIKLVRDKMTQTEFGEEIGLHKNVVGLYERGEHSPNASVLAAVCRRFSINPAWLLLGEGPMKTSTYAQSGSVSAGSEEIPPIDSNRDALKMEALKIHGGLVTTRAFLRFMCDRLRKVEAVLDDLHHIPIIVDALRCRIDDGEKG